MKIRSAQNPATVCFVINFLVIALVLLLLPRLPPVVPLFYGQPQGEDQLANNTLLILPAIIANGFILLNSGLGKAVKDTFLNRVLTALMVGATALSTITIIKIILLIGNL